MIESVHPCGSRIKYYQYYDWRSCRRPTDAKTFLSRCGSLNTKTRTLRIQTHLLTTTLQLSIPSTRNSRIICLQHPRLTLVRLTKRITTLLAHALYLSYFANRLLELLHPIPSLAKPLALTPRTQHTSVYNPEYYTSESPVHDDTPAESTCASHTSTQSPSRDRVAAAPAQSPRTSDPEKAAE